ncbi:MAG: dTDP-4-dehydrorhamnose reductase [Muribaculaceae bacterium]|nr:dTDP-4-dehydrorhamnose reductase [Muribaculaceae bacterium]
MNVLVTGCNGQLGRSLRNILENNADIQCTFVGKEQLDITDRTAVEAFLKASDFTHIINCAAYTDVNGAEENKKLCRDVNIEAVSNLARLAEELDYKILHISTDYVFNGRTWTPYKESDKPEPLSVYGDTKRKGETALLGLAPKSIIIRTGWLYSPYGHNFVKTILQLAKDGKPLKVVADQIGTPTYAADLAGAIVTILNSGNWREGIYNYSNEGTASWYDFAVAVLEEAGMPEKAAEIIPVTSADFPTPAARPPFSVLDKHCIKATYGIKIPHWHEALRRCLANF